MSIGIILQIMPSFPISIVILHIIGGIIIGIGIIIGMPIPIIGFMPIIGFIIPIGPIIGFMPIIGFIIGIIPWLFIGIGIAFIMMRASYVPSSSAQAVCPISRSFPLLV